MSGHFTDRMKKADIVAHYLRETARLEEAVNVAREHADEQTRRAVEAEDALEALDPEAEKNARYMLDELADVFEAAVPVPEMTGEQFETVLESRRMARA